MAPCSGRRRPLRPRGAGPAAAAFVLLLAPGARAAAPVYWLQAVPQDAGQEALRQAVETPTEADRLERLRAVSAAHPGTTASGLAQLAAGLGLFKARRFTEAAAFLQHPDLSRTGVVDHALMGRAQAYDGMRDFSRAAETYQSLLSGHPNSPLLCPALLRGADALAEAGRHSEAPPLLERALRDCAGGEAEALLRLGRVHEARGDRRAAALVYGRLDAEYPASEPARQVAARIKALRAFAPVLASPARIQRDLGKAQALLEAGRAKEAVPLLRALLGPGQPAERADEVRLRLARALQSLNKDRQADRELAAIPAASPFAAEAAFSRARIAAGRSRRLDAYERVVMRFPGTPWAEEALVTMAHHHHKDARESEALPYYRRLLEAFPGGRYVDRANWAVAWADFRQGRLEQAAQRLEEAARRRPNTASTSRFLYWAGRARAGLGQAEGARGLFEETVRRYKHLYHGLRAAEALDLVRAGASSTHPSPTPGEAQADIPEPSLGRLRQLLLIGLLDEALLELRGLPPTPQVHATLAWVEWRRGQLRPAINAMKRAYPEWSGTAGDALADPAWRILYPLRYDDLLLASALHEGLDPALLAAIIWQESTFDPGAVSSAGARGLMQIVPPTGRSLARRLGVRYRLEALHDPALGLRLGTRYFREMLDRFEGRVEHALAAYNAGPGRARIWVAARPGAPAEEFIEGIPYLETRVYVTSILAHREHYRRLYGFPPASARVAGGSLAP